MATFWYIESTCNKKLQYFGVSLYVTIVTSLWRHNNNNFTRYTKTFLNPLHMKFLIYIASQTHIETTTKFCELDYFEKNEKNQNLPLSDLFFIFFREIWFPLWCFPHFLKLLHSVSDSLPEPLVLENCGGNCRVFSLVDIPLFDIDFRKQ